MSLTRGQPQPIGSRFASSGGVTAAHRGRLWRACLAAAAILSTAAAGSSEPAGVSWSRAPVGAQGAISSSLGRDDPSYHASATSGGLRAANRRHGLSIGFSRDGIQIEEGSARLGMSLEALGYGESLAAVSAPTPIARANRVEYCRETLTEWYVNGPFGLEQGFTLETPPSPRASGPLTLSLSMTGGLDLSLEAGGAALMLARGGRAVFTYGSLSAVDSSGRELPVRLELAEESLRLRVDDSGAHYPIAIDPFLKKATLVASDGKPEDFFGISVAISGDTIVVGAYNPPHLDDFLAGAAYVFVKPVSGWSGTLTETAKLTGSDADSGSWFGISVAMSGDTAVVGASLQGAAYVFVKPASGWAGTLTENAKLTASDGANGEEFARVVATDGDTVAVGNFVDAVDGMDFIGSVYVYSKPAAGWGGALTENAKLLASDRAEGDQLGLSLAVVGDTVAAGAPGHDGFEVIVGPTGTQIVPLPNRGEAYVFVRPASGWAGTVTENARLVGSDTRTGALFGSSVGLNTDSAFAGAPGVGVAGEGAGYVFGKPAGGWSGILLENATLVASDAAPGDGLGGALSLSGGSVLLSAAGKSAAYLFVKPSSGWSGSVQQTEKAAFCCEFALSGKTAVVGEDSAERASVWGAPPADQTSKTPNDPNGGDGWYNTPVHIIVTSTDEGGPGVAETRCALDPPVPPRTFRELPAGCRFASPGDDVTADGRHTISVASQDVEGAESTPSAAFFQIDRTPPEVLCDATAVFLLRGPGGEVTASVRDATSGPAASPVSAEVTPADATTAGLKSKDLAGFDDAGNGARASCSYIVRYLFPGFLRPRRETFRAGEAIPVRFKLADASGAPIPDRDARALVSACNVKITFSGGDPSPGCARYDGAAFHLDVRTHRSLPPGNYVIGVEVFAGGNRVNRETLEVTIR